MNDIQVNLSREQCDIIALALDTLMSIRGLKEEVRSEVNMLFYRFDTLSDPVDETRTLPKVTGPQLVYDRDSNVRPLFPKG